MTKEVSRKKKLLLVAGIICLVLLGGFLTLMQTGLSIQSQHENMRENVIQIESVVDKAYASAEQSRVSYDEVYQSKAETVAYMANKDNRFTETTSYLKNMAGRLDVTGIGILDRDGNLIAGSGTEFPDFTRTRYNQLRTVFENGEPSEAFEVEKDGVIRRYYGAKINGSTEVVIAQDPAELHQMQDEINSWESMLSNVKVGLRGYTFAVSSQDYTVLYHPDEAVLGQDSINAGLEVENLEDGFYGWMTMNGQKLYCGVKYLDAYNAYVICAVPEAELVASRNITVGVVLFIFFVVITIVGTYAVLLLQEQAKESGENQESFAVFGNLVYNKALGKKIGALSIVGLVFVMMVSFYMQTLFSLSMRSISNSRQVQDVQATFERNQEDVDLLTAQYNERYLNKCQIASYILGGNPQLQTRQELAALSRVLDIEFMLIFDRNGQEVVSDSSYVNFTVSSNPEDQSYEFGKLLQGVEYVIQDPMPDEVSGAYRQYIGALMYDQTGAPDGFVQISLYPQKLETALAATSLSSVLQGVKASAGGFAFAVDKETHTFSWYPQERMIGRNALAYGMTENQLRDGYCDYITIENQKYYGSSMETDTDYIYVVTPESRINSLRLPVALESTGAGLILLLVIFLLLTFSRVSKGRAGEAEQAAAAEGPMIDVTMPDGRVSKTESAASRWANSSIKWGEKTPEQQISSVLKGLMSILALVICISVLFKDRFFGDDSIFRYVIDGKWERGVNVFAITGCIMIICVISVVVMILRELLRMLSKTFGARGETVCRLIRSFAKYISFIAMLYYCFALFGVDTRTLLASAGILSLVIGLGAKTLVSDILAGLFIIFEGEFRVGDIVTIGDWRGTVQEIGVRTTKIMDPGQNVKIISNSNVNGVINMTRKNSYTFCDVGIEYGESLERVENILAKELPNMKKRLPAIKDGPYYKGVVSLGDNSVNIRIMAQCAESARAQLGRDLNREMKLLFDKYDINIPFPQVVINQPKEYIKATDLEKMRADAFNQTQKELSSQMKDGSDDKS